MKKILVAILTVCMAVMCFAGCGGGEDKKGGKAEDKIKVGFIFLHDEKSTYDLNFMNAAKKAQENLKLSDDQVIFKYPVEEGQACYEAAADLVDQGCDLIFADSFGHEQWLIKAANDFKNVQFCHATGTKAHTEKLANFHNAFATIYEGRYLAGIVAGLKLNEMIKEGKITAEQAVMGYVGAFPYAEVKSGYTAFYLGAKSVCPSVTMKVDFTQAWYSVDDERDVANSLMDQGCVLISQHADSLGAPSACEARKVPNVSYNGSTIDTCPETFMVSSRIDWTPYFEYIINCVVKGEEIKTDWTGTLATGSVVLTDVNEKVVAEGTKAAVEEAKTKLEKGEIHVFDTDTFTVKGEKLTTYLADVDDFGDYKPETEAVKDGYFHESEYRSAPYFDVDIDGITILSTGK